MNKCPNCRIGLAEFRMISQKHSYKGQSFTVELHGESCNHCQKYNVNDDQNKLIKIIIRNKRAEINGLLTSIEVKEIRSKLELTQKEAAVICGGGPNAFSRYERGEATPSRATSNLLRLLNRYPEAVQYLLKIIE